MEGWRPTGLEYLAAVTDLLQRQRVTEPESGLFEAADLQWWWRVDQHPDPRNQLFRDDTAFVLTNWKKAVGCDLLGERREELFPLALERLGEIDSPVQMEVRDDDTDFAPIALEGGFVRSNEGFVTTSVPAGGVPAVGNLPEGFRLLSRAETADLPHHMIGRNGADVAVRLGECSLYEPENDLVITGPNEVVAGYALFWADPVTGVGLVEPVGVEDAFQGRGLGKVLIAEGLRRLAKAGCTTMRVTYELGNDAAERLYLGSGFRPLFSSTTFTLSR